ncbi:MAG: SDR family NAD(P)-dependent oxidoreductase [Planctomycetia bacterium]|nr:SDR family NAD(P)-dependent oxidoreductase [Planctomycetia bacterium]
MNKNPIAIVGLSALFPGSPTVPTFWRNIVAAKDLTCEVPASHWLASDYYAADPKTPDRTYCQRGAFLPEVPFNPLAYGIPPSIIPATDTSQLLSLMLADRVLKDAGGAEKMNLERVGIILGVAGTTELTAHMSGRMAHGQWANGLRKQGFAEEQIEAACVQIADEFVPWQESTFPGLLGNVVAGRIANRFDLGGTNCVVDAACAGSLAAVSMAINELQLGQADMVIAGGVDTLNDPLMFLCFSKTPALSPTGDCRPFSDAADGTILGEGIAMFALKRLADAERDGDHVYALIAGLGSSSDGRAKSVYAPRPDGQARALRRAYEAADFSPRTVELIEAHGTATRVGDRAEFEGLRMVFSEVADEANPTNWCALGSVKSQIGHTKAAAGSAGMFKAVMALHHKVLPPTAKVERPQSEMKIESSPFYLNTEMRPWIRNSEHPRRAGVSSFGFGGSNFHVALEEYTGPAARPAKFRTAPSELFVLAAGSSDSLLKQVDELVNAASSAIHPETFQRLAFETQQKFDRSSSLRLAVIAENGTQAAEKLRRAKSLIADAKLPIKDPSGIYCQQADKTDGQISFLFPGQGSQFIGMGADLALNFEAARETWDKAAEQLPLHDIAFPPTTFIEETRNSQQQRLQSTEWAQPAIGVCSLSYLQLLRAAGVTPDCVAGHSFGELTAFCATGVIDDSTFVKLARRRGEIMNDTVTTPGGMLAVLLTDESRSLLSKPLPPGLVVANHNSPRQVVISGELDAIQKFEQSLTEQHITCQRLQVAHAFHSPQMSAASESFRDLLQKESFHKAKQPVFCNVDAMQHDDPQTLSTLLSRQLHEPVRFQEIVERMYDRGVRVFVEVGPQDVLTKLVGQCLTGRPHLAVAVNRRGAHGVTQFWHALAQLFVEGVSLDFTKLWDEVPTSNGPEAPKPHDIMICGSNYGKPYPANAVPPQPGLPPKPRAAEIRAAEPMLNSFNAESPSVAATYVSQPLAQPLSIPPSSFETPTAMSHNTPEYSPAFDEISRQTASAHQTFLQAMTASHQAFFQAMQNSFSPSDMPGIAVSTPQFSAAPFAVADTQPMNVSSFPAYTNNVGAPSQNQPSHSAPAYTVRPAVREQAIHSTPVEVPQSFASQPASAPAAETIDFSGLLLEVVAEKTGYPTEVLELDMHMESDLGIDSIKRVEILSALVERIPAFAEVETSQIGGLRTLREVLDLINHSAPATAVPRASGGTNASHSSTTAPVATHLPSASSSTADARQTLLAVVAEKTGYPAEVLELDMQLESDLGIDSIKRVEILSALVERIPALAAVETSQIGGLRTLREILEMVQQSAPSEQSAPQSQSVHQPTSRIPAPPTGADFVKLMLAVVAEKTGYPAEVLELDMQLEADLGIDSIKRVEILSTLVERIPSLAAVETSQIGGLRTLREILEMIQQSAPQLESPNQVAQKPAVSVAATTVSHQQTTRASASPAAVDLSKLLLAVVAEKTGYPSDVLELDMEIESGLGIDSIKRVEILSELVDRVPQLQDMDSSVIGGLRTLADILRVIEAHVGGGGPLKGSAEPAQAADVDRPAVVNRFPVLLVDAPPGCFAVSALDSSEELLLFVKNPQGRVTKVAAELQQRLAQQGITARIVATLPDNARQVIHLDGLADIAQPEQALDIVRSAFQTARTMARIGAPANRLFVTVQNTGGRLGVDGCQGPEVFLAGLSGLIKTLSHEWPGSSVKAIDLETKGLTPTELADRLIDELLFAGPEVEIGLSADGRRSTLRCATSGDRSSQNGSTKTLAPSLRDGAVVVVSGGARGVTAHALRELAAGVRCKFILLGRTALETEPTWATGVERTNDLKQARLNDRSKGRPALSDVERDVQRVLTQREVRANIAALEKAGSEVCYLDVDLLDAAKLQTALQNVRKKWGPISGLIHAAGVLADRRVEDKTDEQFDSVLRTKVTGLRHLLDATREHPLSLIALFSSVAARFGNVGQCDYAAANEILNKLAASEQKRRGQACLVKSFNWGPWDGGMVTPGLKAMFAQRGVSLIPLVGGGQVFANELLHPQDRHAEVVVVAGEAADSLGNSTAPKNALDLRVNRTRYPFLDSHCIEDVPVVPVVLAVEWFHRAAQSLNPGRAVIAIRDVKVLKGILLHDLDRGQNLRIVSEPIDASTIQLELTDVRGVKHYRCIAELSGPLEQSEPQLNWSRMKNGKTWPWSVEHVYDQLFHGPDFHVIKSLDALGDEGGAATMQLSGRTTWPHGPWQTQPVVLDGAIQLALLWGVQSSGKTSIPMSVGTYRGYIRPQETPMSCEVRLRHQSRHANHFDIRILSESNEVVAELENLEMVLHLDARGHRA